MAEWYVVHSRPGAEEQARAHLEQQGLTVYLPRCSKRRSHARKVDAAVVPLFPRYLFVRLDLDRDRWRNVFSTRGVQTLLGSAERPLPVADAVIDDIRNREDDTGLIALDQSEPTPGQAITLTQGPLAELSGLYDGRDSNNRVRVLLDLLGRRIRATLPAESIAPQRS